MADDYLSERGSSRTWVDAEIAGESLAVQRGGDSPPARTRAADLGFEPNLQREADLVLLRALGEDTTLSFAGGLTEGEREAFANMLTQLTASNRRYETLSLPQREWATRRAKELEIDLRDPAERNRDVPRGREVAPAAVLQNLPKTPPGRRAANGSQEQASIGRGPLVGGPCPDCGKALMISESGWACLNGHGWGEPNPPVSLGPFETEAGRAVTGQPLPARAPDTTLRRPTAGVVGARRRPAALGRPK